MDPNNAFAQNNKAFAINHLRESSGHIEHREDKKKIKWYTSDGKPIYD
jgi:hypothetical protein